jgi:pimeloyl-ACP methyl ester carboxylesterase
MLMEYYGQILKSGPQSIREQLVGTSFGTTFVREFGAPAAPAILFLHGSSSNSAMWLAEIAVFSQTHHVYAVDVIGECGKSAESRPPFTHHQYAGWLDEVFRSLDIGRAILVGCSLGGWIALDFAIRYPEKTVKLVLLATAGITPIKAGTILWILVTSLFGKWGFNNLNKMVYGNLHIDKDALQFARLVRDHYRPRTDVLPLFADEDLRKIDLPVLFIGGEKDCFYHTAHTSAKLKATVRDCTTLQLPGIGHVLVNQASVILRFVQKAPWV